LSFIILHSAFFLQIVGPMERLALSWGNARQFTKLLLSLLSHIGVKMACRAEARSKSSGLARLRS